MKINCFSAKLPDVFYKELPPIRQKVDFEEIKKVLPLNGIEEGSVRFHFVRHAESLGKTENLVAGGTKHHSLNDNGHKQSLVLAKEFASSEGLGFAAVYYSPYKAAVETANYVIVELGLQSSSGIDKRLKQKHWGSFHGKKINDDYKAMKLKGENRSQELTVFKDKFEFKFEEGETKEESLLEVFERVVSFMGTMAQRDDLRNKEVIVITHTPILKALFSAAVACQFERDLEYHWFDFGNLGKVIIDVNRVGEASIVGIVKAEFRPDQKYK